MTPLIVAEIGAAHCGSLDRALALVDVAKECGANAVKLQTWGVMTVADHVIEAGPWAGKQLADLYAEARTPWEWHAPIFERCKALELVGFSTPFDEASVDFLETLGVPLYKIASFEITHVPLIRKAASTGKHLIISTGMASEEEIETALDAAMISGAGGITLLKCVSAYPASPEDFNLITMAHMLERFHCHVGLSDHTLGSTVAVAATALGATVIEKHLSLDSQGPDGGFAAFPEEFAAMVRDVRACATAVGGVLYGPTEAEAESLKLRRSLWITKDIAAGESLTRENMAILRPMGGMEPEHFDVMLGKAVTRDVPRGTAVSRDMLAG